MFTAIDPAAQSVNPHKIPFTVVIDFGHMVVMLRLWRQIDLRPRFVTSIWTVSAILLLMFLGCLCVL